MKTKEEILEQVSGLSIDFIKEHHDTIPLKEYLEAMEIYAQQQVKNLNIPAVSNNEVALIALLKDIKFSYINTGGIMPQEMERLNKAINDC